ncbi:MAG: GH92 family glycosyl hydrolase [Chloroflexota bacterium]
MRTRMRLGVGALAVTVVVLIGSRALQVRTAPAPTVVGVHAKRQTAALFDLAGRVDPFIGTFGNGMVFPGADVPFGMVQWSPDTGPTGITRPGGYFYRDAHITGFPLTHLSGAGCVQFDDIPIMPTTKPVTISPSVGSYPYSERFTHAGERASPGYYAVRLGSGVHVQLSTTPHTGAGRYTFPRGSSARILVNAGGSAGATNNHDEAEDAGARVTGSYEVSGWATSGHFCGLNNRYTVYFVARFDRPFLSWGTWQGEVVRSGSRAVHGRRSGVWVGFSHSHRVIRMRVGLSFVSERNARLNLSSENPGWSFDAIRRQARDSWNRVLNLIQVSGGPGEQIQSFYTALYHACLHPNVFSDVNGQYAGFDGRVHIVRGRSQYANFSGWDIFRTQIPLLAWLQPLRTNAMMQSLIDDGHQMGRLPKWPVANAESNEMNGDSADPILASAWAFGAHGFDAHAALALMVHGATNGRPGPGGYVERPGLHNFLRLGYLPPQAGAYGAAATTLEYAVDDFAVARLAYALGDRRTGSTFMRRAQAWQFLVNPASGFVEPVFSNGAFAVDFNPTSTAGFVEGNAWEYTWWVPQNLHALFRALGGDNIVIPRLDRLFQRFADNAGTRYAWLGNEPGFEIPWQYDFTHEPWRTQGLVRRIVNTLYPRTPYGLPGNDDLGTMSAWLVWADLGMYPEIPGVGTLTLSSPIFSDASIHLPGEHVLHLAARSAQSNAPYIRSVTLRGRSFMHAFISLGELAGGGEMRFQLARTPNRRWGNGPGDSPPSYSEGEAPALGFTDRSAVSLSSGRSTTILLGVRNLSDTALRVRWTMNGIPGIRSAPEMGFLNVAPAASGRQHVILTASPALLIGHHALGIRFQAEVRGSGGTTWRSLPRRALDVSIR